MKECAEGSSAPSGWMKPALGEDFAGRVFDDEIDPGFVEVALLGHEEWAMPLF